MASLCYPCLITLDQHGPALRQNKYKPELIDCDKLKPEVEEEADRGDRSPSFSPFLQIFLKEKSYFVWISGLAVKQVKARDRDADLVSWENVRDKSIFISRKLCSYEHFLSSKACQTIFIECPILLNIRQLLLSITILYYSILHHLCRRILTHLLERSSSVLCQLTTSSGDKIILLLIPLWNRLKFSLFFSYRIDPKTGWLSTNTVSLVLFSKRLNVKPISCNEDSNLP